MPTVISFLIKFNLSGLGGTYQYSIAFARWRLDFARSINDRSLYGVNNALRFYDSDAACLDWSKRI